LLIAEDEGVRGTLFSAGQIDWLILMKEAAASPHFLGSFGDEAA
jgi:hypothetical protein